MYGPPRTTISSKIIPKLYTSPFCVAILPAVTVKGSNSGEIHSSSTVNIYRKIIILDFISNFIIGTHMLGYTTYIIIGL